MVSKYDTGLKHFCYKTYRNLNFTVIKGISYRKIVGKPKISDQFSLIVICYKRKGYKVVVIKQSACLAVDPIMVDHFVYLFNYTPVGWGSDSEGQTL